jgi:PEP-CTERM motif
VEVALKPTHILLPAALAAALLAAGHADAAVIFNNGGPNQTVVQFADTSYFFTEAADEFTLAAGSNVVSDVHWWGGCVTNDGGTLTSGTNCPTGDFTLHIYSDSGSNSPGTLLAAYNVGNANQTLTGLSIAARGGIPEYHYSADIPALTLTPGTEYWLGISNSTTTDVVWGWEVTVQGTGDAFQFGDGVWNSRANELAFNLTGGVPEPGTLAVFAAGAIGLGRLRRRPKARL